LNRKEQVFINQKLNQRLPVSFLEKSINYNYMILLKLRVFLKEVKVQLVHYDLLNIL
jgi:hypothetical protein